MNIATQNVDARSAMTRADFLRMLMREPHDERRVLTMLATGWKALVDEDDIDIAQRLVARGLVESSHSELAWRLSSRIVDDAGSNVVAFAPRRNVACVLTLRGVTTETHGEPA